MYIWNESDLKGEYIIACDISSSDNSDYSHIEIYMVKDDKLIKIKEVNN